MPRSNRIQLAGVVFHALNLDNKRREGFEDAANYNTSARVTPGICTHPLFFSDMAHRVDAVSWWNAEGINYGPKAPEVRAFMLDPTNYELQPYWINRSKGALLTERYKQY